MLDTDVTLHDKLEFLRRRAPNELATLKGQFGDDVVNAHLDPLLGGDSDDGNLLGSSVDEAIVRLLADDTKIAKVFQGHIEQVSRTSDVLFGISLVGVALTFASQFLVDSTYPTASMLLNGVGLMVAMVGILKTYLVKDVLRGLVEGETRYKLLREFGRESKGNRRVQSSVANKFLALEDTFKAELDTPASSGPNTQSLAPAALTPLTILMVSACPDTQVRLRVDTEFRKIIDRMRGTRFRDRFRFEQIQAARFDDLRTALLEHHPHVLHISSHGESDGTLVFEGAHKVSKRNLLALLKPLSDNLQLVVINACHSHQIARDIPPTISLTIGMSDQIKDTAAIDFAVAFYEGLGFGKPVEIAFKIALAGLGNQDDEVPQLFGSPVARGRPCGG